MLPGGVLAAMFTFYPMVMSWYFSLLNWSGVTTARDFIGLGNYRELFGDRLFWNAFGRSFLFTLIATPIQMCLALLVAIVLNNQARRLSTTFRTLFFMPAVVSTAVIGVIMTTIFSGFHGPANTVLEKLHLISSPIDFLTNTQTALGTVIGVQVWQQVGLTMIYWLAALQTVPQEYYEAARVDGAGRWNILRHIIIPILIPFVVIILVLTANQNLHAFAIVQSMTRGGPYYSTQVIEVFIYQTAFASGSNGVSAGLPRLGYASAAGCMFGVATFLIALLQAWAAQRLAASRRGIASSTGEEPAK